MARAVAKERQGDQGRGEEEAGAEAIATEEQDGDRVGHRRRERREDDGGDDAADDDRDRRAVATARWDGGDDAGGDAAIIEGEKTVVDHSGSSASQARRASRPRAM